MQDFYHITTPLSFYGLFSSLVFNTIHSREKLLDHTVDLPIMRIKWLMNLELVLLEHISIYHQQNTRSKDKLNSKTNHYSNDALPYNIDASFISIIITNFLKIFIIRNLNNDQDELSNFQFGLTSHLRYLLVDLPTYKHQNTNENSCVQCDQYSSLINTLFDLLFDLIEYDLCEITNKTTYRSTLIENDYFNQFIQSKKSIKRNKFDRVKLIIYLIELIAIHRNKCQNKKQIFHTNETQMFLLMKNFLQHIISNINK